MDMTPSKNNNSESQIEKMALNAWNGCEHQPKKVALNTKLKIIALNVKLKKWLWMLEMTLNVKLRNDYERQIKNNGS